MHDNELSVPTSFFVLIRLSRIGETISEIRIVIMNGDILDGNTLTLSSSE
ncbi:hypothetical protein [Paenisporosarcina antarctica]|nr:hypothetical protein [Paenisporosarcina antarctica]